MLYLELENGPGRAAQEELLRITQDKRQIWIQIGTLKMQIPVNSFSLQFDFWTF